MAFLDVVYTPESWSFELSFPHALFNCIEHAAFQAQEALFA
jgi:hypothetical protein